MKKLLFIAFLCLGSVTIQAQDLKWHTDFNEASKIAFKEKKPLLLFFTGSDWCGWCKRLQQEVLTQKEFKTWAEKNVVLVESDFPRRKKLSEDQLKQNYQLQNLLGVRGYPTIWLVNIEKNTSNDIQIDKLGKTGYVRGGAAAWLATANSIINTEK